MPYALAWLPLRGEPSPRRDFVHLHSSLCYRCRFAETRAASGSADRKTTSANPTPLREALVCVSGEDDWRKPLLVSPSEMQPFGMAKPRLCDAATSAQLRASPEQGGGACVALGKFDAMHVGHRELAARCAAMGETPFLVSFWGMAEVLGWEGRLPVGEPLARYALYLTITSTLLSNGFDTRRPRPSTLLAVAPQDRSRVLQSWAPHCAGRAPRQRVLPFRAIREMPPEDFVEFLARDLGATG